MTQIINLPEPEYPMLTHVVSEPIAPDEKLPAGKEQPLHWIVSKPHPLMAGMKIVRMFLHDDDDDLRIYSVSDDGKYGLRNTIPRSDIRISEEAMPIDIFAEELSEEEGDDEVPEPVPEVPAPVPNGQSATP